MKRSQIKRRPLADTVLASLEPEEKDYQEKDSNGLYFRVRANGSKSWNLRYKRPDGKWAWHGMGAFPSVSGKLARKKAQELLDLAADGHDIKGYTDRIQDKPLFSEAAENWYQRKLDAGRAYGTTRQMRLYLDKDILPALGHMPLDEITRRDCADVQATFEKRDAHIISGKVRSWLSQIFSLAVAQGKCEVNPASELRHIAAEPPKAKHYPHLLEPELPDFLRALRQSKSRGIVVKAVWIILYTASRPGMVRHMEWPELDIENGVWTIAAEKMKARRDHLVPLPRQVIEILHEVHEVTGRQRWVFPGQGAVNTIMSDATFNKVIKLVGYKDRMVGHGSRHTASTLLREHGWNKDYVEAQLAHKEAGLAGVYNQAAYYAQRQVMMQWYADYLDALADGMSDESKQSFRGQVMA